MDVKKRSSKTIWKEGVEEKNRMMEQRFENYTLEDKKVWKTLFSRQVENLQDKACGEYLDCLLQMKEVLNEDEIPKFENLNEVLKASTGWTIEVVPGLIPPEDFFELLAQKKFCSSTWLRSMEQLDYLEEPDMFHDVFGHIPLLMNKAYGDFMQNMGKLGVQFKSSKTIITELQRIYWFTIEFGLLKGDRPEIYGAGIISSFGETNGIYKEGTVVNRFDIQKIAKTDFNSSEIQKQYFLLNSLEDLYSSFEEYQYQLKVRLRNTLFS